MKRASFGFVLIFVLAACGGGTGSTTTGGEDTITTGAPTTTGTATTSATTTTGATTLPADAHPVFGVSWASVFPDAGETATYRVTRFDGSTAELPAVFEYGVDFRGTTVDRLVVGEAEPGNEGWALYFDRSEPWIFTVIASEVFDPSVADGPSMTELFEDPIAFDGTLDIGETFSIESQITLESTFSTVTLDVTYAMTPATIEDSLEVPIGTVDGAIRLEVEVGGEFIGGLFEVKVWLHPDHALVRFEGAPAWDVMELVETWG